MTDITEEYMTKLPTAANDAEGDNKYRGYIIWIERARKRDST